MTEEEDATKTVEKEPLDEEALEKQAVEELMREAVQGAARAELVGPSGWIKSAKQKTNKRFLANTIRHAVSSNRYHSTRNRYRRSRSRSPRREHPHSNSTKRRSSNKN